MSSASEYRKKLIEQYSGKSSKKKDDEEEKKSNISSTNTSSTETTKPYKKSSYREELLKKYTTDKIKSTDVDQWFDDVSKAFKDLEADNTQDYSERVKNLLNSSKDVYNYLQNNKDYLEDFDLWDKAFSQNRSALRNLDKLYYDKNYELNKIDNMSVDEIRAKVEASETVGNVLENATKALEARKKGAPDEKLEKDLEYVVEKYGLDPDSVKESDIRRIYLTIGDDLKPIDLDAETPESSIAYYDADGTAVSWKNLLRIKSTEERMENMQKSPETKTAYDELVTYRDDIKRLENAQFAISAKAEGIAPDAEYEKDLEYVIEKYGIDPALDMKQPIYEIYMQLVDGSYSGMAEQKAVLESAGYDWAEIDAYKKYFEDKEREKELQKSYRMVAEDYPALSTVFSIASAPGQIFDYAKDLVYMAQNAGAADDSFRGMANVYDNGATNFTGTITSSVANKIDKDVTEATGQEWVGWLASSAYSGGTSALQSAMTTAVSVGLFGAGAGSKISLGLQASQAASSSFSSAIKNGSTNGEALATSISSGVAEALFEKVSLDHFLKISKGYDVTSLSGLFKSIAKDSKNLVLQGLVESSEEMFTEMANNLADDIINGDHSGYSNAVAQYKSKGYSEEKAKKAATIDYATNVLSAMVGGFIGGVSSGGVAVGTNAIKGTTAYMDYQNETVKPHGSAIISRGSKDSLMEFARETAKTDSNLNKYIDKVTKRASAKNVGTLSLKVEQSLSKQNLSDITKHFENKGIETKEAKKLAGYANKLLEGETLTQEDKTELRKLKVGEAQIKSALADIVSDPESPINIREANLLMARIGLKGNITNELTKSSTAKVTETKDAIESGEVAVSEDGKAKILSSGETVTIDKNNAIAKIEDVDGNTVVYYNTDKGEVAASDISYASESDALLYEAFTDLSPSVASSLIRSYANIENNPVPVDAYVEGMREGILFYGKYGFREVGKDILEGSAFAKLPKQYQSAALNIGREVSKNETKTKQDKINSGATKTNENGKGRVYFENGAKAGNSSQKRAVALAKHIASAIGINIAFYDSTISGTRNSDANGWFDRETDTIHLDLQKATSDKHTIAFTLSHEIVHFIEKWSPEKYKVLADFLMTQYAKHGVKTEVLLQNKMAALGTTDVDLAYREMVADAMESMLLDSNATVKLMELRQKDAGLFNKLKAHILDLINKIRNEYKNRGYEPTSEEGKAVRAMEDSLSEFHKLFEEAFVGATESYQNADTKTDKSSDGRVQKQAKTKSQITIGMTDTERSEILKTKSLVAPIYAGQADETISINKKDLESQKIGLIKAALVRIGDEFDVFTDYNIDDVDVQITLSKSNLRESISKEASPVQLAKLLPVLKDTVENAIGIESHSNRYFYDNTTVFFENLLGGYVDGEWFIPVRFGLKHINTGKATLYVIVDQQKVEKKKIKADIVNTSRPQKTEAYVSPSTFKCTIPQIVSFVKSKDLLRYLPDNILNAEQKQIKWEGISETITNTNYKNDVHYKKVVKEGNLRAAQEMVRAAAKAAGYTIEAWHGTRSEFNVFSKEKRGTNTHTEVSNHWFFSADKETANSYYPYGVLKELSKQNPKMFKDSDAENLKNKGNLYHLYLKMENPLVVDVADYDYASHREKMDAWMEFVREAEEKGNDGIILLNAMDNQLNPSARESTVYMFKESSQAKSADAITHDDNDNVIPVSQRFDEKNSDIRFQKKQVDPISERDIKKMESHFGTTTKYAVAGYLLTSGKMLDFSGRHWGDTTSTFRQVDHRDIQEVLEDENNGVNAMIKMIGNGNIRLMPETGGINLATMPTASQITTLRGYINSFRGEVIVDVDEVGGDTIHTFTYNKGTSSSRILSDIKNYFENGTIPETQSNIADFLFQKKATSNRELLANALEDTVQNDDEKKMLTQYKKQIDLLNAEEQKLHGLRRQIKDLFFTKGKRDTEKIMELQTQANNSATLINKYDRELLKLESAKALKNVLEREKKLAYQKAEKKGKEALAAYREKSAATVRELLERNQETRKKSFERRKASEMRDKIKKFKAKLERSLLNPTDRVYVPINLANAMIGVCDLIDTDTPLYKADGSINKAQERRNLTKDRLQALKDEYEALKDNADPTYSGEYDEVIYKYLTKLRNEFGEKALTDMTYEELSEMYDVLKSIEGTLQDARKLIGRTDAQTIYDAADSIISEQAKITKKRKNGKRNAAQRAKDNIIDLSLSPVRNVERMSGYNQNSELVKLFNDFEKGVRQKNFFVMQAYKEFEKLTTGDNSKAYEDAIYEEYGDKKYVDVNGRKFGISKMQMMQTILSYEREVANNMHHIEGSGFAFADMDMLRKGKLKEAVSEEYSHRLPAAVALVEEFKSALENDKWAQEYMETSRKFFNGTAKDAINETYLTLKHRIIARDKNYIPFEVDKNFVVREISAQNDIQQTINSYGMLQETKQGASQPLIITGLNNILDRHIDQVGNVYGLAVPVRNFNKVWNVRSTESDFGDPSVQAAIQRNWGLGGTKHITQTVQDLQGSRPNSQSDIYRKIKSGYIGATFLLNLSVVTKQIGSLYAATSMLKWRGTFRMTTNLLGTMINSKKVSAEVDKYTATAWMRRQGLSDSELYTLITESKKPGLLNFFSKFPTVINPSKWITAMDHAVALSLWKYAKQDTAKRTGLKGEELLRATAEFYDSVIENTQSMTDVLHRPEIQKRSDVVSEAFGMFKTDLYQMAGQLQLSLGRFNANKNAENGKVLGRTVYAILRSAIWGSLMTSLFALLRYKVNPYRDDDDKDLTIWSWLKRQLFGLGGDIVGYFLPLAGSEIVGVFENIMYGESDDIVDSLALTAINDLYDAMITAGSAIKDGEMPSAEQYTKLTVKALQVFGVPANNIKRMVDAIKLHAKDIANGQPFSYEAGAERSAANYMHGIVDEIVAGNTDEAEKRFDKAAEDKGEAKLRTALGNMYKDGEVDADTTKDILSEYFGMDDDEIYWQFDKWDYAKENDTSEGYAKYDDFYSAVESGKNLKSVIKRYMDNGVEKKTLASQITSHYKPLYIEMSRNERANLKGYLLNAYVQLGYNRNEKSKDIDKWLED